MNLFRLMICAWLLVNVQAASANDGYKTIKGRYHIYAGELGDETAPTAKDRKVSIIITGQAAKEMFMSMGPDDKHTCGSVPGDRSRSKQHLWCTYSRADGYTCYFGFDLRTGASIGGGIC